MHPPVGTEIEATAQWLEGRAAAGAATVLRRVARQRDEARARLNTLLGRGTRHALAWASARRRARDRTAQVQQLMRQLHHTYPPSDSQQQPMSRREQQVLRENALMRVDIARFQNLAERAGWMPDTEPRRLWRWRHGWWELAYRKKNPKDGYPDSGWYLRGPTENDAGHWVAALKAAAMVEADRHITKHLATTGKAAP